jgi:hypothetical protein
LSKIGHFLIDNGFLLSLSELTKAVKQKNRRAGSQRQLQLKLECAERAPQLGQHATG